MSVPKIKTEAFDHFTIVVADLTASRRFYIEVLGLREVERPAFDFAGLWLAVGGHLVHLIQVSELSGRAGPHNHDNRKPSRGLHFAFRVADATQSADVFRREGIEIVDGPKQRPDGATQVFVRDPDGWLIELCSC